MSDINLPKAYLRRITAIQSLGLAATFLTIWIAVGGLLGATLAGAICGLNAASLHLLLRLVRHSHDTGS